MRTFLRLMALLITLLAVFMLPFALFGFEIGQILFSPAAMLDLVASEVIGPSPTNVLSETLLEALPEEWGINSESMLGKALISATRQPGANTTLLPMDLQIEYAAQGLDSFYAWLDGPEPLPVLELDMVPLKSHLNQSAEPLVGDVLELLPLCSAEESLALLATLFDALLGGEATLDSLPPCLPAVIPAETVAPAAGELLRSQIALIPDSVVLENLVQASSERMLQIKNRLLLAEGALRWGWLPVFFLLLIAALLGGQTSDGIAFWLGGSLIAGGILTYLITLVPIGWWLALILPQLRNWPLILQVPGAALSGLIVDMAADSTVWWAVGLAIGGIVLLILGLLFHRFAKKPAF